ncbi:MAG TPA: hypothetical protein VMF32_11415, partial [Xanthobacteraceae bacterium]|nr:hypothetical protein [Xanthobacteraceae bacterium]
MARIISPTAYLAAVTAMLVSGTILGLPINIVRADDNCLTAPGAAPSEGQHWYYRTDRVNHRKCWYLHATVPLPNHTAAEPSAAASQPVLPAAPPQSPSAAAPQQTNAASAPDTAADTSKDVPSTADSTQPAPHVTVLTVKTVTVPSVPATSTPAAIEQTNEPPMPQTSAGDGKRPVEEHTKPVRAVDPA